MKKPTVSVPFSFAPALAARSRLITLNKRLLANAIVVRPFDQPRGLLTRSIYKELLMTRALDPGHQCLRRQISLNGYQKSIALLSLTARLVAVSGLNRSSHASGHHIEHYREIMTDASGHDEEVPNRVMVRDPLERVEQNASRVEQSARQQPEYA
jgi:hypothetical protein